MFQRAEPRCQPRGGRAHVARHGGDGGPLHAAGQRLHAHEGLHPKRVLHRYRRELPLVETSMSTYTFVKL